VKLGEQAPVIFYPYFRPFQDKLRSDRVNDDCGLLSPTHTQSKNSPSVQAKIFLPEEVSASISHPPNRIMIIPAVARQEIGKNFGWCVDLVLHDAAT
jgi:hypothetical protein